MAFNVLNPDGTVNRNDVARLALVACDASYAGTTLPVGAPLAPFQDPPNPDISCPYAPEVLNSGYQVLERLQDDATGFKAVLFRNSVTNDVIVAFAGTDGLNPKDWWGNGFHYGWNQWQENRQEVFNILAGLGGSSFSGRIHFTGQSLGGALAQYAAYEFVQGNGTFDKQRLTLTTFNALGGIAALEQSLGGTFNHDLIAGMGSIAHYRTRNDFVSRLGASHLGADTVYEVPYRPGGFNPDTNSPYEIDLVTTHRIESGFYSNLKEEDGWFGNPLRKSPDYLYIPNFQRAASFFGNPLKRQSVSNPEAIVRFASGALFAAIAAPASETNQLIWSLARAQLDAGAIRKDAYLGIAQIDWGRTAKAWGIAVTVLSPIVLLTTWVGSLVLSRLASGFGLPTAGAVSGVQNEFGPAESVKQAAEVSAAQNEARFKVLMAAMEAPPRSQLASVDAEGLAEKLASGLGWENASLDYVQQASGLTGADLAMLDARFGALMYDAALTAESDDGSYASELLSVLAEHFKETAKKVANSNADFTLKYANVDPRVFGVAADFSSYDALHDSLQEAVDDPSNGRVRHLLEDSIKTVEAAGQTVFIGLDRNSNPFDEVGFDPNSAPLPVAQLGEGSVETLTVYLPYEASEGGQRIKLTLAGAAADKLMLYAGQDEIELDADGTFTLTVPQGQREVSFEIFALEDVDADASFHLSAQLVSLVDGSEVPTHQEHQEVDLSLDAEAETPPAGGLEYRGDWNVKYYRRLNPDGTPAVDDLGRPIYESRIDPRYPHFRNVERTTDPVPLDMPAFYQLGGVFRVAPLGPKMSSIHGHEGADQVWMGVANGTDVTRTLEGDDQVTGSELAGNQIYAGAGNDWVEGGAFAEHAEDYWEFSFSGRTIKLGDDKIHGGSGDDEIWGESETTQGELEDPNATATGLPGDWIAAGSGADRVYGSSGDDVLLGGTGEDQMVGGAGMDVLLGDDDFGIAVEGNFWGVVHTNFGDSTFSGFEVGLFPIYNYAPLITNPTDIDPNIQDPYVGYYKEGGGADILVGGSGKDILIGQFGNDVLYGGADDDILAGWEGEDQLVGGEGDDKIAGDFGRYEGPSQRLIATPNLGMVGLVGSSAFDASQVDQVGNDFLDGGRGSDAVFGEGGDDVVYGRDGADVLYGDANYLPEDLHGADLLDGGLGADTLYAGAGNDRLFGGDGNDTLNAEAGDDQAEGGAGDDELAGGEGDDRLAGGEGVDALLGEAGADLLRGGAGDDTLEGGSDDDVLYGESGSDQLTGGDGVDTLYGGSGEDVVEGDDGADRIDGGSGIDIVRGGAGDDTYVFSLGYGGDLIEDTQGRNRISFGFGIAPEMLAASLDAATLSAEVSYGFAGDTVTVSMNSFDLGGISFADGSSWSQKEFLQLLPALQTEGSSDGDALAGNPYLRNELRGFEGDDTLAGASHDDVLEGGEGADTLDGAGGSDRYVYSAIDTGIDALGDSEIAARVYLDWYYGNLGIKDWLERLQYGGKYRLLASGDGGEFVEYLDTYDDAYTRYGDAAIVLVEPLPSVAPLIRRDDAAAIEELIAAGVMSRDVVQFGADLSLADLTLTMTVSAADAAEHPGEPWLAAGTLAIRWMDGGFNLEVPGVTYDFSGANLLTDGQAPETDEPGAWRGYRLGSGIETFAFADGTTLTLDDLLAQATIIELAGPYHVTRDSGAQTISRNYEAIVFDDGIRAHEIAITRDGVDLLLTGAGAEVRVARWFSDPANMPVARLEFDFDPPIDAPTMTEAVLVVNGSDAADNMIGLDGFSDTFYGYGGEDTLIGGSGDDFLYGFSGNDVLVGGPGDDTLDGGADADVFVLEPGTGHDRVLPAFYGEPITDDVLRAAPGLGPDDLLFSRDWSGMSVWVRGTGDRIEMNRWFHAPEWRVAGIEFADGTFITADEMEARLQPAPGTADNDVIFGSEGDDAIEAFNGEDEVYAGASDDVVDGGDDGDVIVGDAGNDILRGGEGDDDVEDWEGRNVLDGGPGDDYLYHEGNAFVAGGPGDDDIRICGPDGVIAYNPEDGNDTIYAADAFTLSLGGGIADGDLSLGQDGTDLVLAIAGGGVIRFSRKFEEDPSAWPSITLQTFASVHGFDFNGVIDELYSQAAGDPTFVLALDGLLGAYEISFSETKALGGALAWRYATTGTLEGLTPHEISSVLAARGFGSTPQPITLGDGTDNAAPTVTNVIADQGAREDLPFAFTLAEDTFSDPDPGDSLTYSASLAGGGLLPGWLSFDPDTRTLSGTPIQADVGTLAVRVTAADTGGLSVSNDFTLIIRNVNDAPVVRNPLVDQGATEDLPFTFAVPADTFDDEDAGDSRLYSASLADGQPLPAWLGFDADSITFSGTPDEGDDGTFSVRLTATDAAGASASVVFDVAVMALNDAPIIANPIRDLSADEDAPFEFAIPENTFADPDPGDTMTYTAHGPAWLSFDPDTGTFSGTPLQSDVGAVSVRVIATDAGGLAVEDDFVLTVTNVNDAPTLTSPIADQTASEDADYAFSVPEETFADEDLEDVLSWFASRPDGTALPGWLSFDALTRAFSGTPANGDVGNFAVQVTATDAADASAATTFTLTVENVNDAPVLAVQLADRAATEDQPFVFAVPVETFSDVDAADALTLSAAELPAWLSFDPQNQTFSGTPRNADVGSYDIGLTATDSAGTSVSDTFHLTVLNVNDAPVVAEALGEQSFEAGSPFSFVAPRSIFADEDAGDSLSLSANLVGGGQLPSWLTFDPATAMFIGNPGKRENGISHIVLTATDAAGASVSTGFGLVIRAQPNATVVGGNGDDVMYGGIGNNVLVAHAGNDGLFAGEGNDVLLAGKGNDVLLGGTGNDVLHGGKGQNLLDGGAGSDVIFGGWGSSLIVGGTGNDLIHAGRGNDVLLFNRGDGSDTVLADRSGDNTLSFGGGIDYDDITLSRSGKDLIVGAGGDDRVVLKNWYAGKHSVANLQFVLDSGEVQTFDFLRLTGAFDSARRASPGLTSWDITNALLQVHLWGGNDDALGGDLAYWYARNRSLRGISLAAAQRVLGDASFGADAQNLRPFNGLEEGLVKLG